MALSFKGIDPVEFGGKTCIPSINAETRMRLATIKKYGPETDSILASAFPDDEVYVKDFLNNRMTVFDKVKLHAFLMGGEEMVATVVDELGKKLSEQVSESPKETVNV